MPFVYAIAQGTPGTPLQSNTTPNTETSNMQIRQTTRGVDVNSIYVTGRGAALTTITGLSFIVRRWTTVGTGGTASAISPRRIGTTASTTAFDSASAITQGTVSGAIQAHFGCGASGPGGWVARDADSAMHLEGGSSDDFDIVSLTGVASMLFSMSAEIAE